VPNGTVKAEPELVKKFVAMGFAEDDVVQVLRSTGNSVEETTERLLEFVYDEDDHDDQSDSYDQTSISFEDGEMLRNGGGMDDDRNFADDLAEVMALSEEEAKQTERIQLAQDIALKEALRRSVEEERMYAANGFRPNGFASYAAANGTDDVAVPQYAAVPMDQYGSSGGAVGAAGSLDDEEFALKEALRLSAEEEAPNGTAYHESFARDGGLGTLRNEPMAGAEVVAASDELVAQLVAMDFPLAAVTSALQRTRNNLDAALAGL
jgi:hypothetical protein